ncbi:Holliday junction branch migration protein RuvA [Clostridium sp. D2Q-11]|uniref:Holliday junction branch migration complex subunit RuvA n=1 Tax=Anaeromonas frigoriresistens TaxID=2683708 RepID=A0A942ZAC8_9FIRM|nr:Holliday junction branch migration protein RuvA [Anaeromonas frigoriresistens]MBS4539675.1 Holliday junction branch migration protein RuvA [Anaeromonas frigoriresistens]
MYSYIRGYIEEISEDYIVLDNNGIGYKINTSMQTMANIKLNEEYKIFTHLHVREDDMSLYGFISKEELGLFLNLISVSKIGPKVGLGILSALSVDEVKFAIISEDPNTLSKAPGVGKKTANRMILELKDKVKDYDINKLESKPVSMNSNIDEALDALMSLGYTKYEATNAMNKLNTENLKTQEIIKLSLNELSKQ